MRKVRGYKVFDPDWKCRGFQYTVGATYTFDGKLEMCVGGFHFCLEPAACFNYKVFNPNNKCAEVEALGKVVTEGDKSVTNKIKIVREIPWDEMLKLCNSGRYNTGYANIGVYNSGMRNVGNWNTGMRNTGDDNTGDMNVGSFNSGAFNRGHHNTGFGNLGNWNTGSNNYGNYNVGQFNFGSYNAGNFNLGDYNAGHFNTETHAYMFNKPLPKTVNVSWPRWFCSVMPTTWVPASEATTEVLKDNEYISMQCGYLRKNYTDWREAWKKALAKAKASSDWPEELKRTLDLPNFSYKVFEQITGITRKELLS